MSKGQRIRLPLLLLLGALTIAGVLIPTPALASPSCSGRDPGHYENTDSVSGYTNSLCGPITFCVIGTQHFSWDCVDDGNGGTYVDNVVADPPSFCNCNGYEARKCC